MLRFYVFLYILTLLCGSSARAQMTKVPGTSPEGKLIATWTSLHEKDSVAENGYPLRLSMERWARITPGPDGSKEEAITTHFQHQKDSAHLIQWFDSRARRINARMTQPQSSFSIKYDSRDSVREFRSAVTVGGKTDSDVRSYLYNHHGKLTEISSANGYLDRYFWDTFGRLDSEIASVAGKNENRYYYRYPSDTTEVEENVSRDSVIRVTYRTFNSSGRKLREVVYNPIPQYDPSKLPTVFTERVPRITVKEYDAAGGIASESHWRVDSSLIDRRTFNYSTKGEVVLTTFEHGDNEGNITSKNEEELRYTYNEHGDPIRIEKWDSRGLIEVQTMEYTY